MSQKLKAGQELEFLGYEDLDEDMEPFFDPGDTVIIESISVTTNGKEKTVKTVDLEKHDGDLKVRVYKEGAEDRVDTVYYPGEVDFANDDQEEDQEEAEEEAVEEKPKKKAAAKKAAPKKKAEAKKKAAPKKKTATKKKAEEVEAEEEAEVEEKPKAKKTAKKKVAPKKETAKKTTKKKAETKAPARTDAEGEQEEVHHTKTVEDLLKEQDALDAARALVRQGEQTFLNLGGVLAEIRSTKAYVSAGYDGDKGFQEYCKTELNMEYRHAMYLVQIYNTILPLGVDEDRLIRIGWTKARELCQYITEENAESLLLAAEEMNKEELIEHVKTTYVSAKTGEAAKERVKKVKYSFQAFEDQAEIVGAALERAKETNGSDDINAAFLAIITEWADMTEGVEVPLEDALTMVENKYGVTLEIVEDEEEEAA